ncbi:MAG: CDP-glycerol glycerophosphotransferase family protein [Chloroflexota bacterium]|nr:CDP-glycerol glycerophosphotransferase family protein [Chloroflexota bacterium]
MAGVFARPSTPVRGPSGRASPEVDPVAADGPGSILRFEPSPPAQAPDGGSIPDGRSIAVLDTAWTAPNGAGDGPIGLREVAERVLAAGDPNAQTAELLDRWAAASGIVEAMTIEGTSFWYYGRVAHAAWLREQILWLGILDELITTLGPNGIECAAGSDDALVEAARLVAARDGLTIHAEGRTVAAPAPVRSAGARPRPSLVRRLARRVRSLVRPDERTRRGRVVLGRLADLSRGPQRPLLTVHSHAVQRVDGPDGPRLIDPYLDPIEGRLRGTRLDPVTVELRSSIDDDDTWRRLSGPAAGRILPVDVVRLVDAPQGEDRIRAAADAAADRIGQLTVPLIVSGVDLGPELAARVASQARHLLVSRAISIQRIRKLLRRLRPAGLLLADEYHRQDWLSAAHAEGVRTIAVQHGLIYRWHNGYVHASRPDALRLPDRTYTFGPWERRLLTEASVYRADEVRVGGSPRLDLVAPERVDREAVRAELGVAPGDRLVVVSGTWGSTFRRFHYPLSLARLIDRALPGVHLVVKLHPSEPDEGPYRATIEGAAAAGGYQAPPITVVRTVDLYRLLAAADAHLGISSTVLTEAVAAGTPNLLADTFAGSDLLGYVSAGVALPVRSGADVLAALEATAAGAISDAARQAFLRDHFEPGDASARIATELLEWLP